MVLLFPLTLSACASWSMRRALTAEPCLRLLLEGVAEDVSSVTLSVVVVFHFMVVESGDDSALEAYVAMSCLEFGV